MVQRCAPHKTEKQCREIIRTRDYKSPSRDGRDVLRRADEVIE
jgi:hypothetical protein